MKKTIGLFVATLWLSFGSAHAADGLVTVPSNFSATQTLDRLEAALKDGGATVFTRIDHAANAAKIDMVLRPTQLLIFGNPKSGTPLMQVQQTIGIELPMKALAWEDAAGKVWLSYNDPAWIAGRHGAATETSKTNDALAATLKALAAKATTSP